MKNGQWLVGLLLLGWSACGGSGESGQFDPVDQRKELGLHGNIRQVHAETYLVEPMERHWEQEPYGLEHLEFDPQGRLLRRILRNGSNSEVRDTLIYGKNGLLEEERQMAQRVGLTHKARFVYSASGQLAESQEFNPQGKLLRQEKNVYDDQGQLATRRILQMIPRPAQEPLEVRVREEYQYDAAGKLARYERYERGSLAMARNYVAGKVSEEWWYQEGDSEWDRHRSLQRSLRGDLLVGRVEARDGHLLELDSTTLDPEGRILDFCRYDGEGNLLYFYRNSFGEQGELLSEVHGNRSESPQGPAVLVDSVHYEWEFDDSGNWTLSDRFRNGEPDRRIRRHLDYWQP